MWLVQLMGSSTELTALASSLTENNCTIAPDGQGFVLISDKFTADDDAAAVRDKALQLVAILNGATRLALDSTNSIGVGAIYRESERGKRDIIIFPEPAVSRLRVTAPTVVLTHSDGTVEEFHPTDQVRQWASMALANDAVARVFRMLAEGPLDWGRLYRMLEVIEKEVGGLQFISKKGWASRASIGLFKHTANSPEAAGPSARHGATTKAPPKKPMSIQEARSMLQSIIYAWLRASKP